MTCVCGQTIRDDDWMGLMGHYGCQQDYDRRRRSDPGYQREQAEEQARQQRWAREEKSRKFEEEFNRTRDRYRGQEFTQPRRRATAPGAIDLTIVRKLLLLCHPDKHGNSELSGEITRWLIDVKKRLEVV